MKSSCTVLGATAHARRERDRKGAGESEPVYASRVNFYFLRVKYTDFYDVFLCVLAVDNPFCPEQFKAEQKGTIRA